jgi:hypothetical protein
VGLLRSEFLFMERRDAPTEDEQFENYKSIAQALGADRSLIIRTLDVGGDKPLSYLPIPKEDNPFLGERGVRVGLDRPEVLRTQLRAILRASKFGRISVMFPMIATLDELRDVKAILAEEAASLGVSPIPTGIMVEVPAAAVMAAQFAREADFFSVGTNDLTQYTLAMDRGHPKLAPQVDGPESSCAPPHRAHGPRRAGVGRPVRVGVCGGIASDPCAVPILIGIGVDELSVSMPAIPAVKAQVRTLRLDECRMLAEQALAADSAADVRALSRIPTPSPSKGGTDMALLKNAFPFMQKIGKCMMLPVSVLPGGGHLAGRRQRELLVAAAERLADHGRVGQRDLRRPAAALRHRRRYRPDGQRRRRRARRRRGLRRLPRRVGDLRKAARHRDVHHHGHPVDRDGRVRRDHCGADRRLGVQPLLQDTVAQLPRLLRG